MWLINPPGLTTTNPTDSQGEEDEDLTESGSEDEEETEEESDDGAEDEDVSSLTENQRRLLYMISCYTKPSLADQDKSEWIRRNALIVLKTVSAHFPSRRSGWQPIERLDCFTRRITRFF